MSAQGPKPYLNEIHLQYSVIQMENDIHIAAKRMTCGRQNECPYTVGESSGNLDIYKTNVQILSTMYKVTCANNIKH